MAFAAGFDLAHYGWLLLVFMCGPAVIGAVITASVAAGEGALPRGGIGAQSRPRGRAPWPRPPG